jgi:prepilin-type N-terminal cleavage/methylation domain-containing protein/prepilin-type processing-associated H-X9-DG protein
MSRRRGFTLVELLVVVAILAILVALLLPALSRVRQQALSVKCAGNLRVMGHALTLYTTSYDYYPGGEAYRFAGDGWVAPGYAIWPTRLRALLGHNQEVFHCPSRGDEFRWENTAAGGTPAGPLYFQFGYEPGEPLLDGGMTRFSYGYNNYGTGNETYDDYGRGLGGSIMPDRTLPTAYLNREVRARRVRSPSDMIAIADGEGNGVGDFVIHPIGWNGGNQLGKLHLPSSVHGGGCNVLFCDGHVQWYAQRELMLHGVNPAQWPAVAAMWNNDHKQ